MKVLFKSAWFGPSEVQREGKINQSSGRRYRPGIHFVPAELKDLLPKSAKILEDDTPPPAPVSRDPGLSLRDFDETRAAGDAETEKAQEAEEALRKNAERLQAELAAEEADKPKKGKR